MRAPKLSIAAALLVLAILASTMTYTGFLFVGGFVFEIFRLLLGGLFARFPWFSKGKLRTVGLLPKLVRRPIMVTLLVLCLLSFLLQGDYVPALFIGFATAFLVAFPWLRRALFGRILSSMFKSTTNKNAQKNTNGTVIDVEFREKKD